MEAFKCYNGIIRDHPPRNKGALCLRNNLVKYRPQAVDKALGHHFVNDVAQANGPEVLQRLGVISFWNEDDHSVIETFREDTSIKEI